MMIRMMMVGLVVMLAAACARPYYPGETPAYGASSSVSREEAMDIARSYANHKWTPRRKNVLHGTDPRGVRVDTPDGSYGASRRYGWKVGEVYQGVPYKWGGFDTPGSFDRKVREGRPAGDMYSQEKRRLLEAAVSEYAAGIDCSGFVSRCWRLERSYSTRELPRLCEPLARFDMLKKGDLVSKFNDHAILFAGWVDEGRTEFYAYEAGAPPFRKTQYVTYRVSYLTEEEFKPYRYKKMRN